MVRASTPANTLVVADNIDDMISLDPAEAYERGDGEVVANLYGRLVRYEADDLSHLTGDVAESWKVDASGKTYSFALRRGLYFSNGDPVTAEDVAFSLRRVVRLGKTPSFLLTQFGWTPGNVASLVNPVSSYLLQVTVVNALAPTLVLNVIGSSVGSVVDEKVALAHQIDEDLGHGWLKFHSAGSGPYVLRVWRPNQSVVLEANSGYHLGAPGLQRVIIQHIPDAITQRLMLEKGDVDIARDLTGDQIAGLAGNREIVVNAHPSVDSYYIALNQTDPRLANPAVREALHYLIDYQGMVATILSEQFRTDQSFLPLGIWSAVPLTPYHLDVARAKQLLAQAGYANGFDITMDVCSAPPWTQMALSVQATMAQAGIRVKLLTAQEKQIWTRYRTRQHQMLMIMWSPDYLDPDSSATAFAQNLDNSPASPEKTLAWRNHWSDPALSGQVEAAVREHDPATREAMYQTLQRELLAEGPYLSMFQAIALVAQRRNVHGFLLGPYWDLISYRGTAK